MTNKEFYAFCRDRRKTETDPYRKKGLEDVYGYLWQCGVSKAGVRYYLDHQLFTSKKDPGLQQAYRWILETFDPLNATDAQRLFSSQNGRRTH